MTNRIYGTGSMVFVCSLMMTACTSTPMQEARTSGWDHFGADVNHNRPVLALGEIEGNEANVIVQGKIADVCQMKGCWIKVSDGTDELFVRFQDYSFFVPMDSAGREVVMNGTAVTNMASVEELRHYAKDAGQSDEEIARITAPEERITFYANSVYIK